MICLTFTMGLGCYWSMAVAPIPAVSFHEKGGGSKFDFGLLVAKPRRGHAIEHRPVSGDRAERAGVRSCLGRPQVGGVVQQIATSPGSQAGNRRLTSIRN